MEQLSDILSTPNLTHKQRLILLRHSLVEIDQRFQSIPLSYTKDRPLIGIVGEIYCRLNEFSNEYLVNKIEELGGEAWMTDIGEWLWYTNDEQRWRLIRAGKKYSKDMLFAKIKFKIMRRDEDFLLKPLRKTFRGYEEPHDVKHVLNYSRSFLPQDGALGDMVLNVGKSIYLQKKGGEYGIL